MKQAAHLTKPGWSKPHTHSNPTNLALFRHKITLYRFNQGAHTIAGGGSNGSRGAQPPRAPLTLTTGLNYFGTVVAAPCLGPRVTLICGGELTRGRKGVQKIVENVLKLSFHSVAQVFFVQTVSRSQKLLLNGGVVCLAISREKKIGGNGVSEHATVL